MDCRRHDARQAACLLAVILLSSCGSGTSKGLSSLFATQPPFPTTSSHLTFGVTSIGGPERIYWLDEERVLFPGYELSSPGSATIENGVSVSPPGVYVWNTASGMVERRANLTTHWWFCFNDGYIAYNTEKNATDQPRSFRAGQLGAEREVPSVEPWHKTPELEKCRGWPSFGPRPEHPNAWIWNLAPHDGYIVVAEAAPGTGNYVDLHNQNESVELHRADGVVMALPIQRKELDISTVTYAAFSRQYVFIPTRWRGNDTMVVTNWPRDAQVPIYLVSGNGSVQVVKLPIGVDKPSAAYVTRLGVVWVSNRIPSGSTHGAGMWLLRNGSGQKLVDHIVVAAGVSPDGCKIAYSTSDLDARTRNPVRMMNLCAGEKK